MFLKSLNIKGFKSFADSTTLEFEPGVTVIVGPNGSGKSNVVDAVAWVLGSQSPSTIRSSKMDDVIFAGTTKRPALGRAEVSLTIDNASGVLPIDFTEVTITRTLFRSGDSEYAINGVPCRLLDIQELLSDTGVGRHQHVIVSQGHLDAILQARPEDRRLVIEEAAGVLKYRRRREKAQRRLEATEANLVRLGDLLREVRRQLRPLERQADAARRHGSLLGELRSIRLYMSGHELAAQKSRLATAIETNRDLEAKEKELRSELARLDTEVMRTEVELTAQGSNETSDALVRVEGLRQRARGLHALLLEKKRNVERELDAFLDQELIASLEADANRLKDELTQVEYDARQLGPRMEELVGQEAKLVSERDAFEAEWGGADFTAQTDAAERRGELNALRNSVQSAQSQLLNIENQLAKLDELANAVSPQLVEARQSHRAAEAELAPASAELAALAEELERAQSMHNQAQTNLRNAEREHSKWSARAEAFAAAIEATNIGSADQLQSVQGVVGTLMELIDVDSGWERAIEVALGEAFSAVVMKDADAAKRAVSELRSKNLGGVVLALGVKLSGNVEGNSVRRYVSSKNSEINLLLDRLLSTTVVADSWESAVDIVISNAATTAVTKQGEKFSKNGWQTGPAGVGITKATLDDAKARAKSAGDAEVLSAEQFNRAEAALTEARNHEVELRGRTAGIELAVREAVAVVHGLEVQESEIVSQRAQLNEQVEERRERIARDEARIIELEKMLPMLAAEEESARDRSELYKAARSKIDERSSAVSTLRTDLEVRAAGIEERRNFIANRLEEVELRLSKHSAEREVAAQRRAAIEFRAQAAESLATMTEERIFMLEGVLNELQAERAEQTAKAQQAASALDGLRRSRTQAERSLMEMQERKQRAQIDETEAQIRIEALVEQIRTEFDVEPEVAIAAPIPEIGNGPEMAQRSRELERELKIMGPINPLALEEYESLSERSTFLEQQLDDVKSSRKELQKVIKEVDAEIVQVFSAAFADVSENFKMLFDMLFPGGAGQIRLTDPDNLLETGVEIEARPSGKNLRKLSLLSGGERSLTALGFLFAVFRSRPSPFYLLDEVEAALDDVNLHRFLQLVNEFRNEAQLLIVSHQKRTMESGDALYGVSMQPGGSSKVVSERVKQSV